MKTLPNQRASESAVDKRNYTPHPPVKTIRVIVFGDNDINGVGRAAAGALAKRLIAKGTDVEVKIPEICGDWNDQLQGRV